MKRVFSWIGFILILVLSACTAPVIPSTESAQQLQPAQPSNAPPVRSISVNGSGQVTLAPDVAYVYIGVHSQAASVTDALNQNNQKSQAIASSLNELNIEMKDIQTSGFNISLQQQVSPQGEPTGTEYSVDNTVFVTVHDLQVLGKMLDVVVRSGANSISGINFDVLDKSKALSEARKLAVESARSQAEEMAQAAGVTLGDLQTMNVYTSNPPTPVFEGKGGAGLNASQVPVSAGQMILRVEVSAVYAIK